VNAGLKARVRGLVNGLNQGVLLLKGGRLVNGLNKAILGTGHYLWGEVWGICGLHEFFFFDISLAGIFFSVCKNSFPGYSLCTNFFSLNFPLHEFFSVLPPPAHNFSNGPFLSSFVIVCVLLINDLTDSGVIVFWFIDQSLRKLI